MIDKGYGLEMRRLSLGRDGTLERTLLPTVPFAVALVVWFVVSQSGQFRPAQLPAPAQVFSEWLALLLNGRLLRNVWISLQTLAVGLGLAVVSGLLVGLAISTSEWLRDALEPVLTFFYALSGVVWIPLAIVWFGLGAPTIIFVVWNTAFFLILVNTITGVRAVAPVLRDAVRTMGGDRLAVFRYVLLPGALSNILLGGKLAHAFGWRALVASEMIGASAGIGYFTFNASYTFRSDHVMVGILTIGLLVVLIDRIVFDPILRATTARWGMETLKR